MEAIGHTSTTLDTEQSALGKRKYSPPNHKQIKIGKATEHGGVPASDVKTKASTSGTKAGS